ncbi:MAG: hypothetical protein ISN28_14945 [Ectothiorhodospiraceae bacterium AqS1]|nr:hypothetical protein [Ectothiorhodospiraceae bacterium AqS1]
MSEEEKQEVIDRLFQDHEVRLRVHEKFLEKLDAKVDRIEADVKGLYKTIYLGFAALGVIMSIAVGLLSSQSKMLGSQVSSARYRHLHDRR